MDGEVDTTTVDTNSVSLMDAPPAAAPVVEAPAPEAVVEGDPAPVVAEPEAVVEGDPAPVVAEPEAVAEGDPAPVEEEAPQGAPESYTDFTLPEGVTLHADTLTSFQEMAKADNLTQDQAQRYVDAALQLQANWSTQAADAFEATTAGWREATQNDPEFGGAKLTETLAEAKRVRDQFGDDDLRSVLNEFRLGDHPAVVRFFSKVAKATSEDSFVTSGGQSGGSAAALIYNHPSNKK